MDNQHRKIKGYRELDQDEIDLMNEIKAVGTTLDALIRKCAERDTEEAKALNRTHDPVLNEAARWRAIAKTDLQKGLMALTRSVARPGFF